MSDVIRTEEKRVPVAMGTVEATGLTWDLSASKRVTGDDLRAIAALLIEAANRLEREPDRWLDRWMAL